MTTASVSLPARPVDPDLHAYFRFGRVGERVVVTNDVGGWHALSPDDFSAFLAGTLDRDGDTWSQLDAKGFIRATADLDRVADEMRRRQRFVGIGPQRHTLLLDGPEGVMGVETAKAVLDHAMLSTSSTLELRLVASGRPDGDLLAFLVQYATEKNRYEGKQLTWRLVADPTTLDADDLTFLADKRFTLTARVLGEAAVHDAGRAELGLAAFDDIAAALGRYGQIIAARKREAAGMSLAVPITASNSEHGASIVAAACALGIHQLTLEPVLRGPAATTALGAATFYEAFLGAFLNARADGVPLLESLTGALVGRALRLDPPTDPTLRSPAGQGTGEVAYTSDGKLFPSETAVALAREGDTLFELGQVGVISYKDAVTHPTVRTIALAGLLDTLPAAAHDWTTPYLGADPVLSYALTGDLFPKPPTDPVWRLRRGMVVALFSHLLGSDDAARSAIERLAR